MTYNTVITQLLQGVLGMKLTTHFYLLPKSDCVAVCLYFPTRRLGALLKK